MSFSTISLMTLSERKCASSEKQLMCTPGLVSEVDDVVKPQQQFYKRILFSDVWVKWPRPFWGRKWHRHDVSRLMTIAGLHFLCLFAPFYVSKFVVAVSVGVLVITTLFGITLSYHRNLTHMSFTLPKWLEYTCAYCGVLALQGSPIEWVSAHRYHHQYTDTDKDPHSPYEGFWFSHFSWVLDKYYLREKHGKPNNVEDLRKQPFYIFIEKTYPIHPLVLVPLLLYAIGGVPCLVWGMGVRIVISLHFTWLVNSACHIWGKRQWNTDDLSKNNWWVAMFSYGEGWHNNHHAFQYSARHGLEWWQIDMTWGVIKLLEAVGLATNIKLPNEAHKKRMAFPITTYQA